MVRAEHWWNQRYIRLAERLLGHAAAMLLGFVMMVIGLGLGVTMIMLPVGVVIGLLGVAIFVGGLFARIDQKA
jgi:hypothetical protein